MMKKGRVSVVIVNFNSGKYIFQCLKEIYKQDYKDIEVIVIDNDSKDGSTNKLKQMAKKRELILIRSKENLGSSKANNLGIKKSTGEYVLILNADVFLTRDYIKKCVMAILDQKKIGGVVGKLLSSSDHRIIDAAGVELFREGLGSDRGMGEKDTGQYDSEEFVIGACCAAVLYKKEMLEDIKYKNEYYDEDFFAFFEDMDLSVISILLGWKTLYYPSAVAYHVRGGSTSSVSDFVHYLGYRNSEFFYYKTYRHLHGSNLLLRLIVQLIRIFTVKKEIKIKFKKEFREYKERLQKKRDFFLPKFNYSNLHTYVKRSYILFNLKNRINLLK
ncbi:MAG: glycosyltransferase family 2 protein [Spirochaetes bacterium]|nr:glycosyltransferase family 2 protein [Spirochaetota bacterium]